MAISVTFVDLVGGDDITLRCREKARLVIVKARALMRLAVPIGEWDERVVKSSVNGDPLDESEQLSDLGVADGAVLFVDQGKTKVLIKFVNLDIDNKEIEGEFYLWRPLRAAKRRALALMGVRFIEWGQYVVKDSVNGEALDESQNLDDLDIEQDGTVLFLAKA
jgi:hypothetical protein